MKDGRDLFDALTLIAAWLSLVVSIAGVLVTCWLAVSVQSGFNNRRILKDHFIREILEIRQEYLDLLRRLQVGDVFAKEVTFLFQQINIRVEDLMPILVEQFKLTQNFRDYHINILSTVTEIPEYTTKFRGNGKVFLRKDSKEILQSAHANNMGVFTKVIIEINDSR